MSASRRRRASGEADRAAAGPRRRVPRPYAQPVTVAGGGAGLQLRVYAGTRELLSAAGADVVDFDPLIDPLPETPHALVIPGGFPEQFTAELSANQTVRAQIRALAAAGAPVHAECAGAHLSGRRPRRRTDVRGAVRLGAVHRTAHARVPGGRGGGRFRRCTAVGESGHRTRIPPAPQSRSRDGLSERLGASSSAAGTRAADGAVDRGVHAGYLHTHPGRAPASQLPLRRCGRNL